MTIYCDLDGPVLDVSTRYWLVHADVLAELGQVALPYDEYWRLKQKKTPESEILALTGAEAAIDRYTACRLDRIESPTYLAHDGVWPGAYEALRRLREQDRLVLVTLRGRSESLQWQLERLGLAPLFDRVLSSGEPRTPRWGIKADLLRSDGCTEGSAGAIIGDTETDILAGRHLGLKTVGVLSGIRTRALLEAAGADMIVATLAEVPGRLAGAFGPGTGPSAEAAAGA